MRFKNEVKPITHLKTHTAEVVRWVSENRREVLITQNGEARAVVMDVDTYDRWREAMALLQLLARAQTDLEEGRAISTGQAIAGARAAIRRARRSV